MSNQAIFISYLNEEHNYFASEGTRYKSKQERLAAQEKIAELLDFGYVVAGITTDRNRVVVLLVTKS